MIKLGRKRPFGVYKDVLVGEELIRKEGFGQLILVHFDIYNVGTDVLRLRINHSDEIIILNPGEGFQMLEYEVYSCVCLDKGSVQMSGIY